MIKFVRIEYYQYQIVMIWISEKIVLNERGYL